MSAYLQNLWIKLRFSHPLRLVFDAAARLGLVVQPYYLMEEGLSGEVPGAARKPLGGFEFDYLGPEDMKVIAAIPDRKVPVHRLLRLLDEGKRAFGARKGGELAAFTWFDLDTLDRNRIGRPLREDEAYLFDAYTLIPFRGMGIAPVLRYRMYRELEKLGRTRLYSISLYFNTPAVRFKKKLRARILELWIFVRVFRRREWNLRIKRYGDDAFRDIAPPSDTALSSKSYE